MRSHCKPAWTQRLRENTFGYQRFQARTNEPEHGAPGTDPLAGVWEEVVRQLQRKAIIHNSDYGTD